MPNDRSRFSIAVLTAVCVASGCARLIGADFDRGRADAGEVAIGIGDAGDSKNTGASSAPDATDSGDMADDGDAGDTGDTSDTGDGGDTGDTAADTDNNGDAADSGRDGDGSADDCDAACTLNETRCAAGGRLERCVAQDGCPTWTLVRTCAEGELCCDGACKSIDSTNCFACGLACDSTRPACALDTHACACTKTSCPSGQECTGGACLGSSVLPLAAPRPWTPSVFVGDVQTSFADVDGDGRADAIVVNSSGITVARASANGAFIRNTWVTTGPFRGAYETAFADVTGDGCADAIAVGNASIIVRRSNCTDAFGPSESWGPRDAATWSTQFADADGDGCADAIDVEPKRVVVRPALPCRVSGATAGQFNPTPQVWIDGEFLGTDGNFFADVTGDGKADAIVWNRNVDYDGPTGRRSDGTRFLQNEKWSWDALNGALQVLFGDVTGDGAADLVAVKADGAYILRSNRWFFGVAERISDSAFSPPPTVAGNRFALADVTGDGRADLVQVNNDGVWVSIVVDRQIPIRFVQLVEDGAAALGQDQLADAVARANAVYRPAGVQFFVQGSEVMTSAALHDLTKSAAASAADLAAAKATFNPACNVGTDVAGRSPIEQMKLLATRCAPDGEIVVYVARVSSSTALLPWEGKAFFMDPTDFAPAAPNRFRLAHELGHYLGLPHAFGCCGDTTLSHPDLVVGNFKNPSTGAVAPLSLFWDLVYAPAGVSNYMFDSAVSAAVSENDLRPIQATANLTDLTSGWYCPSGNAIRPCPANAAPGAICVQVSDPQGETRNYCTGDVELQGLGLRLRDDTPTINIMSAGYLLPVSDPTDVSGRPPGLSQSQIDQIRLVLASDIDTPIRDAGGQIIRGGRPRLGQ
jgi:FG-GAP-like repeat